LENIDFGVAHVKKNMKAWIRSLGSASLKKPLPILSFPCVSLLGVSVRELISNSDLQANGMKAVADRVDAAAAVSFMDLSVEAECFGATVTVSDDEVPTIKGRFIHDTDEAEALAVPPMGSGRTQIYVDAIQKATELITDRPVIAGMIGPFSLAARLLDVSEIMIDCYDDPDMVHTVLEKVTAFLISYALAFKAAGAHGVMMAEPVAGLLSPALEEEFSSPYVKRIVDAVQDDEFVLIYHNCGDNVPKMLDSILSTGSAAYHFGNAVDMSAILAELPADTVAMGNIDPAGVLRMGTPDSVRKATAVLMEKCAKHQNFVPSSGCDIPPATPWENIDAFFEAVKCYER
jgi:uroporphyrinogen decarboxylase